MSFAIDFGTSNTVIARWNPVSQAAEVINLPGLSESATSCLIPSLVYVENAATNSITIGQQVIRNELTNTEPQRLFRHFKRGIGVEIQGYLPVLDQQTITLDQVGAWFMQGVYQALGRQYPDAQKSLILTVPVDSFEAYHLWLTEVFQKFELEQIQILDEPTAAALGYGLGDANNLLVIDFGGGTLDLVLIQQRRSTQSQRGTFLKWGQQIWSSRPESNISRPVNVIAKAGRTLGGSDVDLWLAQHFQAQAKLPITPWTLRLMERLKIQLSITNQATEFYRDTARGTEQTLTLTRAELEAILEQHQFFERLDHTLNQVLQQARNHSLNRDDLEAVVLIGGMCQMPAVQAWSRHHFPEEKIAAHHPLTAVATGALALQQGQTIEDFLYHSYGIRYWDHRLQRHNWHPIIAQGQSYPMLQPIELVLGASTPDQPGLELIIGELGQAQERTEIFFVNGQLITKITKDEPTVQALNDHEATRTLAQLNPPGQPGSDRLKILFWVDEQRQLRISVDDLLTKTRIVDNQLVVNLK